MTPQEIVYLVFGAVLILALVLDLGLLSKKGQTVTIKKALIQTLFWVGLALAFFVFVWLEDGHKPALEYLSAYLMEWSLSIDNIFVFILIFTAFGVKEQHYGRVLLIGILMAIVFRIIFISVGIGLVEKFSWILYIFGAFLLYTGVKMFSANDDEQFDPKENKVYKFLNRILPLVPHDGNGKLVIKTNGKRQYTTLFVVVVLLASIDLVFALDSIPAVMGISTDRLVIYTSNIFAVLGLRSLFFLLRRAVHMFDYLPKGIAIVLVFIGLKMLGEHYISMVVSKNMQVVISLLMILVCIVGSILYSIYKKKNDEPLEELNGN
ncbi:TerC/Alx family metal homeostasis membrane protein [Chitinophagaceae bacterium LWZ2-11]